MRHSTNASTIFAQFIFFVVQSSSSNNKKCAKQISFCMHGHAIIRTYRKNIYEIISNYYYEKSSIFVYIVWIVINFLDAARSQYMCVRIPYEWNSF